MPNQTLQATAAVPSVGDGLGDPRRPAFVAPPSPAAVPELLRSVTLQFMASSGFHITDDMTDTVNTHAGLRRATSRGSECHDGSRTRRVW